MHRQSGNVLFLILIAVALFAALSYAVTSSTRTGGGSISKEQAKANASAILQYGAAVRTVVMKMKTINGCTDNSFEFSNAAFTRNDGVLINAANSNAPTDKKCHLFEKEGGGIAPFYPPYSALCPTCAPNPASFKLGASSFRVYQMKGIGTDGISGTETANELVMQIVALNKETCVAINELIGIINPGGNPPPNGFTGSAGVYSNGSLAATGIYLDTSTDGNPFFCSLETGSNYIYKHALLER